VSKKIAIDCINHINLVVESDEAAMAHFVKAYDAEYARKLPKAPSFQAGLFAMGGGLFEYFAPEAYLLNARYGPFHLGVEYQANMDDVREVLANRNIRIIRDIGVAVHTHPQDTLGVSFEFYGENFKGRQWEDIGREIAPVSYWRNEHHMGMSGLLGFSMVTADLDEAVASLANWLQCDVTSERDRPELDARMRTLVLADSRIEVLAPTGDGEVSRFLARYGQGMRSTVFGIADGEKASAFLHQRKLNFTRHASDGRLTVSPESNAGLIFEFAPAE